MASQLSLASASVTDDEGGALSKDEPVLVRANVLRIGVGHERTYHDVQAVSQKGRGVWEILLPGSKVLTVTRSKDCGCGR